MEGTKHENNGVSRSQVGANPPTFSLRLRFQYGRSPINGGVPKFPAKIHWPTNAIQTIRDTHFWDLLL